MLDYASKADIPALKQLWKSCFFDTDRYIDSYFNNLFTLIRLPVCRTGDGTPVSMLSMLPVSLQCGAERYEGHYIYAAATRKDYEGRGLMSRLLEFSCREAKAAGERFSCLLPASETLIRFYGKRGYRPAFCKELVHYPPYGISAPQYVPEARPLVPMEFAALRQAFAARLDTVLLQDPQLYPYLYLELIESGLEPLGLRLDGREHYAVCYPDNGLLMVKETSLCREQLAGCIGYLRERYQCGSAVACFPAEGSGTPTQSGMLRFLGEEFSIGGPAYAGMLMD